MTSIYEIKHYSRVASQNIKQQLKSQILMRSEGSGEEEYCTIERWRLETDDEARSMKPFQRSHHQINPSDYYYY